jgi:hypothetical protein
MDELLVRDRQLGFHVIESGEQVIVLGHDQPIVVHS